MPAREALLASKRNHWMPISLVRQLGQNVEHTRNVGIVFWSVARVLKDGAGYGVNAAAAHAKAHRH
eukprot:6188150-Pleurochrysis_carterae.AAC.4